MCQSDWAETYPESWSNITPGHVWGCFWKRSAFEWRGAESRSPLPIHVWGLHPIHGSLSRAGRWRRGPALVWAQTQSPLALRHECPILRSSDSGGLKPAALWVSSCSSRADTSQSPWLCGPISRLNLVLYIGSVPLDNPNTHVCVFSTDLPWLRMRLCPGKTITILKYH